MCCYSGSRKFRLPFLKWSFCTGYGICNICGKDVFLQFVKENVRKNIIGKSNGETALDYFYTNIEEPGLYLLDEPENSLSIKFQLDLAKYISDSARHFGCQFIISTHSPILLSLEGAKIYDLDEEIVDVKHWTELKNVRSYYEFFKKHEDEF